MQPPAGDAVRAAADELARQNPHSESVDQILTAHGEAIGALTDGLQALTAAIRAINCVMLDDRPKPRKWWRK